VEPEQQRPDGGRVGLVRAVAGHHAVRRAVVLDLRHDALARPVRVLAALGDQAVEAGALEALEPVRGEHRVARDRREMHGWRRTGERLLEQRAALAERTVRAVLVAEREQVEGYEARRRALGEQRDPAGRRVQALLQRPEVEPLRAGDDHLAV
jgi:hypothetical protein